ncbi:MULTISPECIES: hypothetical protein [Paenibacillus]|uniref:hypothetical protein n=1 Tax=Paenibacillus TaxID=44249 RepID=UPI000E2F7132|nr:MULTISPECIES: hypothetical protein [Paenibacillus]MCK9861789.1 hypothetical protein [Paenibacillus sp. ATY16]
MAKASRTEALLWSVALPGFGQLLNGKYIKGILLITLEFLINLKSHLNWVIITSFHGDLPLIEQTNMEWLMFYPCVYMFGIWDAYKDAGEELKVNASLPFAFGAFFGTIGVVYSKDFLGAVWLGLLGIGAGVIVGIGLQSFFRNRVKDT